MTEPRPPTVLISAWRNYSIRYIAYSGVVDALRRGGARVVLLVKDDQVQHYAAKLAGPNVVVEGVRYAEAMRANRGRFLTHQLGVVRKIATGGVTGMRNATDSERVLQYAEQFAGTPRSRALFNVTRLVAAGARASAIVRRALLDVESRVEPGHLYDDVIARHRPDLVLVSSLGWMIDPLLMRAARRKGIAVAGIPHSWDNTSAKGYKGAPVDLAIAWNEPMKREIVAFHDVPPERVFVGGIAHWDWFLGASFDPGPRDAFLRSLGLDPTRATIFFPTASYRLCERSMDVVERLGESLSADALGVPAQLVVRPHPDYFLARSWGRPVDDLRARMDALAARFKGVVFFDLPRVDAFRDDVEMHDRDLVHLARLIRHSNVVLSSYSTVLVEAAIHGTPAVNVALFNFRHTDRPLEEYKNFHHIQRLLAAEAFPTATTFDDLLVEIRADLAAPQRHADGRRRLVAQEVTTNPGRAAEAIGEKLLEVARERAARRGVRA